MKKEFIFIGVLLGIILGLMVFVVGFQIIAANSVNNYYQSHPIIHYAQWNCTTLGYNTTQGLFVQDCWNLTSEGVIGTKMLSPPNSSTLELTVNAFNNVNSISLYIYNTGNFAPEYNGIANKTNVSI